MFKKPLFHYLAMALAVLIIGLVGSQLAGSPTPERAEFSSDFRVDAQKQNDRYFLDMPTLKEVVRIDVNNSRPVYSPLDVDMDSSGNFFVLDWPDNVVKKYTPLGEPAGEFGNGTGQGPGEFLEPSDIAVDDQGRVWVVDPSLGRVTVFNGQGGIDKLIKINFSPMRIAFASDGGFSLLSPMSSEMFRLFDPSGAEGPSLGKLLKRQEKFGIMLDGWIDSHNSENNRKSDSLVFAGYRAGLLVGYNFNGDIKFARWAIDATRKLPRILSYSDGHFRVDRKAPLEALSLSIFRDRFYVLTTVKSTYGNRKGALDVYSIDDGRYLGSYRLPSPAMRVYVTDLGWLIMGKDSVTLWRHEV
jgi:hypothetical protein